MTGNRPEEQSTKLTNSLVHALRMCSFCEELDTIVHLLGKCAASMDRQTNQFRSPLLKSCELKQQQWSTLLRFVKTSKRFH